MSNKVMPKLPRAEALVFQKMLSGIDLSSEQNFKAVYEIVETILIAGLQSITQIMTDMSDPEKKMIELTDNVQFNMLMMATIASAIGRNKETYAETLTHFLVDDMPKEVEEWLK
jgi:hypothetical protein